MSNRFLEKDKREKERADEYLCPPGAEGSLERDGGLHSAKDHYADEGSGDGTVAAGEEGSSDDDSGDCVKFQTRGSYGVSAQGVEREQNAPDGGG